MKIKRESLLHCDNELSNAENHFKWQTESVGQQGDVTAVTTSCSKDIHNSLSATDMTCTRHTEQTGFIQFWWNLPRLSLALWTTQHIWNVIHGRMTSPTWMWCTRLTVDIADRRPFTARVTWGIGDDGLVGRHGVTLHRAAHSCPLINTKLWRTF